MKTSNQLRLISWLFITLIVLSGCSGKTGNTRYLSVDDITVLESEMMLYLHQTFYEFEALGGTDVDVWSISDFSGGKSASDVAKQGAIDNIIMTKVLVKKADELGIVLNEENSQKVNEQAKTYLESLSTSFVEKYQITEEVVSHVLTENYLASQVEQLTKDSYEVTTEELGAKLIENEEYNQMKQRRSRGTELILTVYEVSHIVTYTHKKNNSGEWIPLEKEMVETAEATMNEAMISITEGMAFEDAVLAYSEMEDVENQPMTSQVTLIQLSDQFVDALMPVEVGGVSEILEGEYGYHLFKVVDKLSPSQDDVNAFNESYAAWEEAVFADTRKMIIDEGFRTIYDQWRTGVEVIVEEPLSELDLYEVITSN